MPILESPNPTRMRSLAARRTRTRKTLAAALAGGAAIVLVAGGAAFAWRTTAGADTRDATPARQAAAADSSTTATPTVVPDTIPATITPVPSGPATITITAVGDMIFDRKVKTLIESAGGLAPLDGVSALLDDADITVGNLESPLSDRGTRNAAKDVTFRGDPRGIEGLSASGFDFLSLANNHVLDYGPDALDDTVAALDGAGIAYAGAGADRAAAWKPAVREVGDTTVAFLSFSHILPAGFTATDSRPGLAAGRGNMDAVADAIASAKSTYDYVLVSFHWGVEYEDYANGEQVRDARRAIDAGADMVLSHHPHVIQGIEFYSDRLIVYSTGDFVFDHYSRKTGESFILDARLGPAGVTDVKCTPVYLDAHGAPDVVAGTEARVILERLRDISEPHGTGVSIEGDIARVMP